MSSQCSADIVEILGVLAVICSIKVGIQEPEYTKDIVAALLEHFKHLNHLISCDAGKHSITIDVSCTGVCG